MASVVWDSRRVVFLLRLNWEEVALCGQQGRPQPQSAVLTIMSPAVPPQPGKSLWRP